MPPWPFYDPIACVAIVILFVGAWGWIEDKIKVKSNVRD